MRLWFRGRLERRRVQRQPQVARWSLLTHVLMLLALASGLAAMTGTALWWGLGNPSTAFWRRAHGAALPWSTQDTFDAIKIVLSVVAGVGAVVALTVAYRRQELNEAADHREAAKLFTERFTATAEQLGSDKAAVRLAGMYALARLADDWVAERQTCIDVLCAYLRMPYFRPEKNLLPTDQAPSPSPDASTELRLGAGQEAVSAYQEREVRHTAIRIIAAHLRSTSEMNWYGCRFDLTGAAFDGGDFSRIEVPPGTTLNLDEATFTDGDVIFRKALFRGGTVTMVGANFVGGGLDLSLARFSGGEFYLGDATIRAGCLDFEGAEMTGGTIDFGDAVCSDGEILFENIRISTNAVLTFHGAIFSGTKLSFRGAQFEGGRVLFHGAHFAGSMIEFTEVGFGGTAVDFSGGTITFGGPHMLYFGRLEYGGAVFTKGKLSFDGAKFTAGEMDLRETTFDGADLDMSQPETWTSPPVFDPWGATAPTGLRLPGP